MRSQLIKTLTEIAEKDDRLVVLLGDFSEYAFRDFKARWPDRLYNCGVREQAMVGCAAGLALEGMIPIVYTIAPFLLDRCFEFIKLDLCEQRCHAILVGCDLMDDFYGPTHKQFLSEKALEGLPNFQWHTAKTLGQIEQALGRAMGEPRTHYIHMAKS